MHGRPPPTVVSTIDSDRCLRHDVRMTAATPALLPLATDRCCGSDATPALGEEPAQVLARRLKALADPTRLRLLSLIAAHDGGEACVCDLTDPVGLAQPTVSHHLKQLVDAGFLTREKRGVWAYYALRPGSLEDVTGALVAAASGR